MRTTLAAAMVLVASTSLSYSQQIEGGDRIFAGNNLSTIAKVGPLRMKNMQLKQLLSNSRATTFIIHQPSVSNSANPSNDQGYQLLYAIGRRTILETMKISKEDFDALLTLADEINVQ